MYREKITSDLHDASHKEHQQLINLLANLPRFVKHMA